MSDDDFDGLMLVEKEFGLVPQAYFETEENRLKRSILRECSRALSCYRSEQFSEALDIILALSQFKGLLPNKLLGLAADCGTLCERKLELAEMIFTFADNAAEQGQLSMAMNAVKFIFTFAGGGTDMWVFKSPDTMQAISAILQKVSDQVPRISSRPRKHRKKRYAMVTLNLVDHVLAYSKTAMQWARYLDREECDCYLYFTETTWEEKPQEFSIRFMQPSSFITAPDFMKELSELPVTVRVCPPIASMESSLWLAQQMEEDEIDGVIFQAGVNAPVQWVASELSHVPVITALCLGLNTYKRLDGTIYMNEANLIREKYFWREEWGEQKFICGGADINEAKNTKALSRKDFNIPQDAIVFGLMTNYVDVRVTEEFLACV
ncbi:MAG: hypothetical protein HRT88_05055 [Lentisphaeraceae bacterium]|nr:hypothetical protein [Lentisphaeraceae bacterium]